MTITYWHIGKAINKEVLQNKRAKYGKQVIKNIANDLMLIYGKSFAARNLRRMMQFAELFPDIQIVSTVSTQLTWSHFIELLLLKKTQARLFYAQQTWIYSSSA